MKDIVLNEDIYGIDMKKIFDNEKLYSKYMSVTSFDDLFLNKEKKEHNEIKFVSETKPKPINSKEVMPILFVPAAGEEKSDMDDLIELKEYLKSSSNSIKSKVYEWTKGVAAIYSDGKLFKKSLDNTEGDYVLSTKEAINKKDEINTNSESVFEVGTIGSNNGIVVFQSNKENAIVYLPLEITNEQFDVLHGMIIPRGGFNYSFVHNGMVYENVDANELLKYANNIVVTKKKGTL